MQMFQGTQLFSVEVGGRTLAIEAGLLAPQAGGAVTVRYGDTVLLATAVMSKDVRPGLNFFPLTVEFEERLYAAGRIPGSFFRREGKPSEQAILMSRLVDRPLRPLFPKGMRNEVQVIVTAIATDGQNLMDPLAIIAGSAALAISDIPWNGPIAGTTIGFVDGEFVVNPTAAQMEASGLSLVAAGTEDNILMVEAGANELPEDLVLDALHLAHETNRKVIATIQELRAALGKPKSLPSIFLPAAEVQAEVDTLVASRIAALLAQGLGKVELNSGLDAIQASERHLPSGSPTAPSQRWMSGIPMRPPSKKSRDGASWRTESAPTGAPRPRSAPSACKLAICRVSMAPASSCAEKPMC